MKRVTITTDGACQGNPGPGGWAAILQYNHHRKQISGAAPETTNNRMELQAAIGALSSLNQPCIVDLYTDSKYVMQGMTQWVRRWRVNSWRTADRRPVSNAELWKQLDALCAKHKVEWHWVRGHAGHILNEECDGLARKAIKRLKRQRK